MSGRYYTEMADRLRAAGLHVIEQSGWQTRARSSGGFSDGRPWCAMWHHTASGPNASAQSDADYMSFSADSKPIANILIARNGDVWVLAAGATNTNGKGTGNIHTSRGRVPNDSMNSYAFGMEIQNTGTGQAYSAECIDACFRTSLALTEMAGLQPDDVGTHQAYAWDRKIDPATNWAVAGGWQPRSVTSSGSWSLDDLRVECRRRSSGPTPPPRQEDEMATAILHVPGRHAQFISQGPLLADGSVHCVFATWFGPGDFGPGQSNPFVDDHSAAPDTVHQDTLATTLQRDIVLLGNPEEIIDSTGGWRAEDFYRVIRS